MSLSKRQLTVLTQYPHDAITIERKQDGHVWLTQDGDQVIVSTNYLEELIEALEGI